MSSASVPVSVRRVRIGVLLFLLWWLPFYLLAPAIADLLGKGDDAQARRAITIGIVCIQTVLGLLGAYLAGRELFATLGKVRRRRLLPTAWRIVWSGATDIPQEDLKPPKAESSTGPPATGGASRPRQGNPPPPVPAGVVAPPAGRDIPDDESSSPA